MLAVGIISAAGALMSGAAAVISTLAVLGFLRHRPRRDEDPVTSSREAANSQRSRDSLSPRPFSESDEPSTTATD